MVECRPGRCRCVAAVADRRPRGFAPRRLSGSIAGDQSAKTTFAGKKGETVVVEVEARRLLSELNPILHLYDARGVQIEWAQGTKRLGGDARLTATLPADGDYSVEVHDGLYQGRALGHFRLKIGQFHYADLVYPSAIRRGGKTALQFLGTNLPHDKKFDAEAPPRALFFPAPAPQEATFSGCRPALLSSLSEEILEQPSSSGDLQTIDRPSGIHGRLTSGGEEDRYRIAGTPGQKLRFEVHAQRLGSLLDGVLTVYDATGKNVLATNDDRPGMADPGFDFTVPAGASEIVVGIKDLLGRGGDDVVYRLAVSPQDRPDFSLSLADDRVNVAARGQCTGARRRRAPRVQWPDRSGV